MKKLQILRVDNDLVQKVDLQIGNNIIGRGVITGCDDSQIVKHAVTISLLPDNEMTITPVSPCYLKSTESSRWQLLKLGTTVPIKPGDVCSLIPHKCWFKVILAPDMMEDIKEHALKRTINEDINSDTPTKKLCSESGEGDNLRSANHVLTKMLNNNNDIIKGQNETLNDENLMGDKCATDMVHPNFKEIHNASSKDEDKVLESNSQIICKLQNIDQLPSLEQDPCELQDTSKLVTEVLTGEETFNSFKILDLTSQDNKPVTTDDIISPTSAQTDEPNVSANATVDVLKRERCMYGKECYRKNPHHRAEFSHPGDSDFDIPDNRVECPYGIQCYRKNPQHRMQYKHTRRTGANESRKRRGKQQKQVPLDTLSETEDLSTEESDEESIDESEYEPSSGEESSDADEEIYLSSYKSGSEGEYDTSD